MFNVNPILIDVFGEKGALSIIVSIVFIDIIIIVSMISGSDDIKKYVRIAFFGFNTLFLVPYTIGYLFTERVDHYDLIFIVLVYAASYIFLLHFLFMYFGHYFSILISRWVKMLDYISNTLAFVGVFSIILDISGASALKSGLARTSVVLLTIAFCVRISKTSAEVFEWDIEPSRRRRASAPK